ncbi:PHP domain-containing protein [Halobaculum litoreum]|uniref:histidinol-phosphatase n=1 Tax=Halobaculum litoreum TaxID=3031998 RepID=A0ABD5XSS7_9EURY
MGFADHCSVTRDDHWVAKRDRYARHFDLTYERRRDAIERLRGEYDLAVHDAVEVDYEPGSEDRIAAFLDEAGFDYALGSVHYVGRHTVFSFEDFSTPGTPAPETVVADYYDAVVALASSELFEIAAHVDVIEAHPQLAGRRTDEQVRRVADAFAASRTVPEVNAKRTTRDGEPDLHPTDDLLRALRDRGVRFTVGTDAHRPGSSPSAWTRSHACATRTTSSRSRRPTCVAAAGRDPVRRSNDRVNGRRGGRAFDGLKCRVGGPDGETGVRLFH